MLIHKNKRLERHGGISAMSLKKKPIHVLYRELFRYGKKFDAHPILKLWGREVSTVLQINPGGEYMLTLFARYLAQRQSNWPDQSKGTTTIVTH